MNVRPEFLHPKVLQSVLQQDSRWLLGAWVTVIYLWDGYRSSMCERVHTSAINDIEGSRVPGKPHDFLGPPLFLQALSGYPVLCSPLGFHLSNPEFLGIEGNILSSHLPQQLWLLDTYVYLLSLYACVLSSCVFLGAKKKLFSCRRWEAE